MSYPALDIARKLIQLAEDQFRFGGEKLTNMKLQKLMYYAQGYHLAAFGERLFDDDIESWMYGPVVPSVYDYYAKYEANPLPSEECGIKMNRYAEALFNYVYYFFRNFSAVGLMNRTHTESPWKEALPHNRGTKIPSESIKTYFDAKLPELVRDRVEDDFIVIENLAEDWDHYGTPKPSDFTVQKGREFVGLLSTKSLIYSDIRPAEMGGVDVVFRYSNTAIGVCLMDNAITWYCHHKGDNDLIGGSLVPYTSELFAKLSQMIEEACK